MEQKKRLNIEISSKDHKDIKILAAMRGITASTWIRRMINEAIKKESSYFTKIES